MSQQDLQVDLRRLAQRVYEMVMADMDQLLANLVSGGRLQAGGIAGTNPKEGINVLTAGGDLMAFNGSLYVRVPIGFTGQVLTVIAGMPAWVNGPAIVSLQLDDDSNVDLVDSSSVLLVSD